MRLRAELVQNVDDYRNSAAELRALLSKHGANVDGHRAEVTELLAALRFKQDEKYVEIESRLQALRSETSRDAELPDVGSLDRDVVKRLPERFEDMERRFKVNLAQVHINKENGQLDLERALASHVSREEFHKQKNALWEAIDTHCHDLSDSMRPVTTAAAMNMTYVGSDTGSSVDVAAFG